VANSSALKIVYRVLSWATLAALALTLLLMLHKAPPPNVDYDPAATARVQQKLAAADQAESAGEPSQVQLDSTELNSYLHDNLQLQGAPQTAASAQQQSDPADSADGNRPDPNRPPAISEADPQTVEQVQSTVKDVEIDMEGDLIRAYVVFDFHGEDLSLELDGHLFAQDGYLRFDPVAGKLGSLPLPQSTLSSAVGKLMASPENREKLKLPDDISDVQVVDGHAVVTYK
jgi:hypothetical protein